MPKGILSITDEEIRVEYFTRGKFINQISNEFSVGKKRIRGVVRKEETRRSGGVPGEA